MDDKRMYGIDLLRLVLMFMVSMLHVLGQGGIVYNCNAGTAEYGVYWLMEIIAYCAVDGFALISGYVVTDKPIKFAKIVLMCFQVLFYSFAVTVLLTLCGVDAVWDYKDIVKSAFPLLNGYYWYFTAYFLLFFAMPFLNKYIFSVDEKTSKKIFILLIILFPALGFFADPFGLNGGYSAIWLIVLYCIGAFAKRIKIFEKRKTLTLVLWLIFSVAITWAAKYFFGIGRFINYVSPTILFNALALVVIFSRIKLKGTVVSKLSPLAFGIYLFQMNPVIWNDVLAGAFKFVIEENIVVGVLLVFAFTLAVFVSGMAAEYARKILEKKLRMKAFCEKLVVLADKGLCKLFLLLE